MTSRNPLNPEPPCFYRKLITCCLGCGVIGELLGSTLHGQLTLAPLTQGLVTIAKAPTWLKRRSPKPTPTARAPRNDQRCYACTPPGRCALCCALSAGCGCPQEVAPAPAPGHAIVLCSERDYASDTWARIMHDVRRLRSFFSGG